MSRYVMPSCQVLQVSVDGMDLEKNRHFLRIIRKTNFEIKRQDFDFVLLFLIPWMNNKETPTCEMYSGTLT